MKPYVRKLVLEDLLHIGRTECWLEDMAREGLHLERFGRLGTAVFRRGAPEEVRCRIDVSPAPPEPAQVTLYQEAGWDYVTRSGQLNFYRSPESRNAPELHTDPAQQAATLEGLERQLRRSAILVGALMALFFAMMFFVFFWDATPWKSLADGDLLNQAILCLVEGYLLLMTLGNFFSLRSLHRKLERGVPINHREDWRGPRRRAAMAMGGILVLAAVGAAVPWMQLASRQEMNLTDPAAAGLPVLRLAELEQDPALEPEAGSIIRDGVDFSNWVETRWSPFSRLTESREQGVIPGRTWPDSSGEYSPSVRTTHYRLTFGWMAPYLLQDLMERYHHNPTQPPALLWDTGLDEAWLAGNDLYARLGNQVAVIRYYGQAPAEQWVAAAETFLRENQ